MKTKITFKELWNTYKDVQHAEPKTKLTFLLCGLIGATPFVLLFGWVIGAVIGSLVGAGLFRIFVKLPDKKK